MRVSVCRPCFTGNVSRTVLISFLPASSENRHFSQMQHLTACSHGHNSPIVQAQNIPLPEDLVSVLPSRQALNGVHEGHSDSSKLQRLLHSPTGWPCVSHLPSIPNTQARQAAKAFQWCSVHFDAQLKTVSKSTKICTRRQAQPAGCHHGACLNAATHTKYLLCPSFGGVPARNRRLDGERGRVDKAHDTTDLPAQGGHGKDGARVAGTRYSSAGWPKCVTAFTPKAMPRPPM